MIDTKHQRVGVFIDVQNMYYSARNLFDRKVNFGNVIRKVVGNRQLIRAIAYVVSTKTGENQPFFDALVGEGIEIKEKELKEYLSGAKKADWDVGIAVDAISMSDNLDVVILVSGDGDYIPLVKYLQQKGRIVEVVSFRETTSSQLVEAVGKERYTNMSDHKRSFLIMGRERGPFVAGNGAGSHENGKENHDTTVSPSGDDNGLSPNERALNL